MPSRDRRLRDLRGRQRRDGQVELEHAYDGRREPGRFVWIGLYEPDRRRSSSRSQREFNLHPLAVEDAIQAHQRPKLEVYDEMVFLVLKTARYVDPTEVIELGEVLVFLGDGLPDHGPPRRGELARGRAAGARGRPERLKHGPSSALHAILDTVVDDYQPAIDGLENDIDEVEEQLFSGERVNPAERIYKLQREVLSFRKATAPLVEPIDRLARGHYCRSTRRCASTSAT